MKKSLLARLTAWGLALALLTGCASGGSGGAERAAAFREKEAALRSAALTEELRAELGEAPAGEAARHAVFFSVCNGTERALVYGAAGETLEAAWQAASGKAEAGLRKRGPDPLWVRADIVYLSQSIRAAALAGINEVYSPGGFRFGLALDGGFDTALLEAELNCRGIYDYENGGVDLARLNGYLEEQGRETVEALPEEYTAFQTAGWLCDETGGVLPLGAEEPGFGRRQYTQLDGTTAAALALDGADYLAKLTEDEAGWKALAPALRAQCLGAMAQAYRLTRDEALAAAIDKAASGLAEILAYTDNDMAYLLEDGEITLRGCALTLTAMAECTEASGSGAYVPVCEALGRGLLSLLDTETGRFTYVLDGETMAKKEAPDGASAWDGMGAAALCRLYGLTEDTMWLWAAGLVLDRMSAEDYALHASAWTSYAAAEMTRYETGRTDDYLLALRNAQQNMADIYSADPADPEGLELLLASYRCYRQMLDTGYAAGGFEAGLLLDVIFAQAQKQLDSYQFPEQAMYLDNPQEALGTFVNRTAGFQVLPEEVCGQIRGFLLYAGLYDQLTADRQAAAQEGGTEAP